MSSSHGGGEHERNERLKFAEESYRLGKQAWTGGRFDEALALWRTGFHERFPAFVESRLIQTGLKKLQRECKRKKLAINALEAAAQGILKTTTAPDAPALDSTVHNPNAPVTLGLTPPPEESGTSTNNDSSPLYEFFSYIFFEVGLSPECHESKENLVSARVRWQNEYDQLGEPLYAKFRIALLDCLDGNLDRALEGLSVCQDRFPAKKHQSLHLKEVLEAVKQAQATLLAARQGKLVIATPSAWEQAGFSTPFEARPWKRAGLPPDQAKDFRAAGFTATAAGAWSKIGLSADEAKAWQSAGLSDPDHAKRWHRAGLTPEAALPWEEAFGGDIEKAVLFFKAGFTDPEDARVWQEFFQFPSDAITWKQQGFQAEEARFWYHDAGVKDPYTAKRERELLSKAE